MNAASHHPLLRHRDGRHAHVTNEELFFDLVYAFAITQLSHTLLHHLTLLGALETLVMWFAVWLGWQYTAWVTNWFNPEQPRIRYMLFATMLVALVMAAAIPDAFGERALIFAGCYVAMQVGRTGFIVQQLGNKHPLAANYRRILVWLLISACFWIAGGFAEHGTRLALWGVAVLCEYAAPMFGFPVPMLGRSRTSEWTIEGGHLAERCQLFVIVALGESLLATGGTLAEVARWDAPILSALGATFLGTLAMWWLYFGTSAKNASAKITSSDDPGRVGALFHYVHAVLVIGIIAGAVGNDLAMAHPANHATWPQIMVIALGPIIYLFGSAIYKRIVYSRIPHSHIAGVIALTAIAPIGMNVNLLTMGWITAAILVVVGVWEKQSATA